MKTALIIAFVIIAIVLAVIVLMQEGKGGGFTSAVTGSNSDTYWGKNKGKSKEAILMKVTIVLGFLFMALALLLSSKVVN